MQLLVLLLLAVHHVGLAFLLPHLLELLVTVTCLYYLLIYEITLSPFTLNCSDLLTEFEVVVVL